MPSGHFEHYAMYSHSHIAPWIGPIALVAPLLVLAVLSVVVTGGQWAGRWCDARRSRSRAVASPAGPTRGDGAGRMARAGDAVHGAAVLASDLDRDRTVDRLSEAVGDGRLSFEEGTARIDVALRSRHLRELAGLVADLPALQTASNVPAPHAVHGRALVGGATLVVLAAFTVQITTGLWALWPLAVASVAAAALLSRR